MCENTSRRARPTCRVRPTFIEYFINSTETRNDVFFFQNTPWEEGKNITPLHVLRLSKFSFPKFFFTFLFCYIEPLFGIFEKRVLFPSIEIQTLTNSILLYIMTYAQQTPFTKISHRN